MGGAINSWDINKAVTVSVSGCCQERKGADRKAGMILCTEVLNRRRMCFGRKLKRDN